MKLQFQPSLTINFAEEAYEIHLKPGRYLLEAYGASGGALVDGVFTTARDPKNNDCNPQNDVNNYNGNTICNKYSSQPGSGGYARGILKLTSPTLIYVLTGGVGQYGTGENKGGFDVEVCVK